mmetsp:Transcript_48229/g.95166  ORF Transcript_48229/g.95166 Transcript_48229/m.95166 type:complete len:299 (+) Transcript_48229:506-1402(+)
MHMQASAEGFAKAGLKPTEGEAAVHLALSIAAEEAENARQARRTQGGPTGDRGDTNSPTKEKAGDPALVLGSCGPYGAFLADGSEYRGNYENVSVEEIKSFHRWRLGLIESSGTADAVIFETFPDDKEALAALEVVREFPSLRGRVVFSFSCLDASTLCCQRPLREAVRTLLHRDGGGAGFVTAVGVNCSSPFACTGAVVGESGSCSLREEARKASGRDVGVFVYPNRGELWNDEEKKFEPTDPPCPPLESFVPQWLSSGATAVGGCCRTGPRDVAAVRRELERWIQTRDRKGGTGIK